MKNKQAHNTQSGMASIMFAILMVIVVTLLSIGFAVLVRNDQRQTLDKTLSNQAQYAAESAINLKTKEIIAGVLPPTNPGTCDLSPIVSSGALIPSAPELSGVKITCLLWDSTPTTLRYGAVGISPEYVPLVPSDPSHSIQAVKITWSIVDDLSAMAIGLRNSGNVSKLDLVEFPTLRITGADDSDLRTISVAYINPNNGGTGSVAFNDGTIGNGACALSGTVYSCTVTLNALPSGFNDGGILAISSLGRKASISVQALDTLGTSVAIKNAQVEVDATAKSQDVLRRLKANVSLKPTTWHTGFAAFSDTLCKNYKLDGDTNIKKPDIINVGSDVSNDVCPTPL